MARGKRGSESRRKGRGFVGNSFASEIFLVGESSGCNRSGQKPGRSPKLCVPQIFLQGKCRLRIKNLKKEKLPKDRRKTGGPQGVQEYGECFDFSAIEKNFTGSSLERGKEHKVKIRRSAASEMASPFLLEKELAIPGKNLCHPSRLIE